MPKLPYMQFYPADYVRDTRCLSLAARGAWMDILCALWHAPKRGQRTLTLQGWAGEIGKGVEEVAFVLDELEANGICKILRENGSKMTIVSRRMVRDERIRRMAAKRQQDQRDKSESRGQSRNRHSDVTGIYQKSEVRSQKSEVKEEEKKEREEPPIVPQGGTVVRLVEYSAEFERFWEAFPNKVGKKAAWRAWQRAKDRPSIEKILEAIEIAKQSRRWQEGFIPNPATWLNQGRWMDAPDMPGPRKPASYVDVLIAQGVYG